VQRRKNGTPATHPITGRELRALRRLQRQSEASPFIFLSERGTPLGIAAVPKRGCGQSRRLQVQGSPAHAAACVRIQSRERRRRYTVVAELPGAPEYPAHDQVRRTFGRTVQAVLEGLWLGPYAVDISTILRLPGIAKAKAAGVYKGRHASIDVTEIARMKAEGLD
jgi:hypothetical protein